MYAEVVYSSNLEDLVDNKKFAWFIWTCLFCRMQIHHKRSQVFVDLSHRDSNIKETCFGFEIPKLHD